MTDEEAKKFEQMIDKKRDKVRQMTEEDTVKSMERKLKDVKPLYKWRVWRKWKRVLVYKPFPPDEYHKRR